ncbi:chitinase-3-like protein 1 [Haematobia irritans]|uniref:chitinase-3-like protein 1 n=1 Tax=Haematobia irritans TaxID=7368 RepID=UPI003F50090F
MQILYFTLLLVFIFPQGLITLENGDIVENMINCYYGTWTAERSEKPFWPERIHPELCTHVSYAFIEVTVDETKGPRLSSMANLDWLDDTLALRHRNPNLKIVAAIGGRGVDSTHFSQIARKLEWRKKFVNILMDLFRCYTDLNGIDLHWLYPGSSINPYGDLVDRDDRENFVILLRELNEELSKGNWTLGVSVTGDVEHARMWYDVPNIAENVDYIHLMAYNYTKEDMGIFHAPLVAEKGENNVVDSIAYWLDNGTPHGKLSLGIAFIGRSFRVDSMEKPSMDPEEPSTTIVRALEKLHTLPYNKLCSMVDQANEKNLHFFKDVGASVLMKSSTWLSYESTVSLQAKLDLVYDVGLVGVTIWTVDNDDYEAKCGMSYPLLRAVRKRFNTPRVWNIQKDEL